VASVDEGQDLARRRPHRSISEIGDRNKRKAEHDRSRFSRHDVRSVGRSVICNSHLGPVARIVAAADACKTATEPVPIVSHRKPAPVSWVDRLGRVVSVSRMQRLMPFRGPLIVMYHGIGGADGVRVHDLADQVDALARRRCAVPLRQALVALGTPEAGELAAITFDDGYRDFAETAAPLLAARGLHSTVFVPVVFSKSNRWDVGRMERREIMDVSLLRQPDPAWIDVGAHGATHCRMRDLNTAELERETSGARLRLESVLGRRVELFAYPYGQRADFDRRAEQAVASAGFAAAASTCFGRGSDPAQRFRLRRVGVEASHSIVDVERRLDGAFDWLATKEALAHQGRTLLRRPGAAPPEDGG
jgi:peptidoglycan/xylan/chitin deacetylase (PgdA/CDA1 family)